MSTRPRLAGVPTWALLLLAGLIAACGRADQQSSEITADEARAIADEAYIFAFPMLENYKTMFVQAVYEGGPGYQAPFNHMGHISRLLGPEFTDIVAPNNDTFYSLVWLDLRSEPFVLSVPEIPDRRYYVLQLIDMYQHNFAYVGARTTGFAGGDYKCSRVHAWLSDRDHVTPDDVRAVVNDVLRHRIMLSFEANAGGVTADQVISELVKQVAVA